MKYAKRILASSLLAAFAPLAVAQTTTPSKDLDAQVRVLDQSGANHGQALVSSRIASNFTQLAGSTDNSLALVNALRNGTSATLTTTSTAADGTVTTTSTKVDVPTKPMGWGNVKIALALAQASLASAGITNPTAAQLQAALDGGTVTNADGKTATLAGVLQQRASGMGWGQIAQANGTKLGPVVSGLKHDRAEIEKLPRTSGTGTTTTASASTTTATSGSKNASRGLTTATGAASPASSHGIVTAQGSSSSPGRSGDAPGRGIVSASGSSGANVNASQGHGAGSAGVVTAGNSSAGALTTAQGSEHGKGNGAGNGKGKGG